MDSIRVYISGEDPVTVGVIKRLLVSVSPRFEIISSIPARGGEVKKKVVEMNRLGQEKPVILLTDLDDNVCAPQFKQKLLQGNAPTRYFLLNIAVDEAEAWLMADRSHFADYFGIPINMMPVAKMQKQGGRKPLVEMDFPCKSSYFLTHQLMPHSNKESLRVQMMPRGSACKGPEYNAAVLPFIENVWDIESASSNSDSLQRMVARIKKLELQF